MLSKQFFRDDFIPTRHGRNNEEVNVPKLIPGDLVRYYTDLDKKQTYFEMSSGIVYHRYNCFTESSPYGFNYLHKALVLTKFDNKAPYSEFDNECKYLISLQLLDYKLALKQNRVSRTIEEYKNKLRNVYYAYGKLEFYDEVAFSLESQQELI